MTHITTFISHSILGPFIGSPFSGVRWLQSQPAVIIFKGVWQGTVKRWLLQTNELVNYSSIFFCQFRCSWSRTAPSSVSVTNYSEMMVLNVSIFLCVVEICIWEKYPKSPKIFEWTCCRAALGSVDTFYSLGDIGRHTPQFQSWAMLSADDVLTTVGVELNCDSISASSTVATSIPFPLYDRWGNALLDDQISLVVARSRFDWRFFDSNQLFLYKDDCSAGQYAIYTLLNAVAWYASFCLGALL